MNLDAIRRRRIDQQHKAFVEVSAEELWTAAQYDVPDLLDEIDRLERENVSLRATLALSSSPVGWTGKEPDQCDMDELTEVSGNFRKYYMHPIGGKKKRWSLKRLFSWFPGLGIYIPYGSCGPLKDYKKK